MFTSSTRLALNPMVAIGVRQYVAGRFSDISIHGSWKASGDGKQVLEPAISHRQPTQDALCKPVLLADAGWSAR